MGWLSDYAEARGIEIGMATSTRRERALQTALSRWGQHDADCRMKCECGQLHAFNAHDNSYMDGSSHKAVESTCTCGLYQALVELVRNEVIPPVGDRENAEQKRENAFPAGDLARSIDEQEIRTLAARASEAQNRNIVDLCERALAGEGVAWSRALHVVAMGKQGLWPISRPWKDDE